MFLFQWYAENVQVVVTVISLGAGVFLILFASIKNMSMQKANVWEHEHLRSTAPSPYNRFIYIGIALIVFAFLTLFITDTIHKRLYGKSAFYEEKAPYTPPAPYQKQK